MTQGKQNSTKNTNEPQHTNEIVNEEEKRDERSTLTSEQRPYEEVHFVDASKPVWNYSLLTDEDVRNYQAGTNYALYEKF